MLVVVVVDGVATDPPDNELKKAFPRAWGILGDMFGKRRAN